jgi:RNA polymerase sigma factor (sigma-70 family)
MTASPQRLTGSTDPTTTHVRNRAYDSVLGREEERRHAESLRSAREEFVALVQALPGKVRASAQSEPPASAPCKWPLAKLDAYFRRLAELSSSVPVVAEVLPAATRHKRRIDRAREALALGNLRLVRMIVGRYGFPRALSFDLVQEGNIGLMEAIDRFEPEQGLRFGTYAAWWIRRGILRYVAANRRLIQIPMNVAKLIRELDATRLELRETLGREPEVGELAARMGSAPKRVELLRTVAQPESSLEPASSEGDGMTLIQWLADESACDPLEDVLDRELRDALNGAIEQLKPRERTVVRLRFGLDRERITLRKIGEALGVSRERVRQIQITALRKISLLLKPDALPATRSYLSKTSTT